MCLMAVPTMVLSSEAPPVRSWAQWSAERERQTHQFVLLLEGKGKLDRAVTAAENLAALDRQILEVAGEKSRGEIEAQLISVLDWLNQQYTARENWPAASRVRQEILHLRRQRHGTDDWRTVDARIDLARLEVVQKLDKPRRAELTRAENLSRRGMDLFGRRRATEAIASFQEAFQILQGVLGAESSELADLLTLQARCYSEMGDRARAEPAYRQALEIRRKILGESHPDFANSLNNLAMLYQDQGDYARAEPLLVQASAIDKQALGENHPDYARSLNNLAVLYQHQGDYARAEPIYRQAAEIRQRVLGENHPDYARSLNNWAVVCEAQGNYPRAADLYRQALAIRQKVLGEKHLDYAQSLNNLAGLYQRQGQWAEAEPLLRQTIEIRKQILGENHPDYARSINNLGALYEGQADYLRAEPLYRQALAIRKKTLGESHPDYAQSLDSLAGLYHRQGDSLRAGSLLRGALAIRRKALGETHPDYAASLHNLAELYGEQGNYAAAEPLYRQALEIRKKCLGENHPDYAASLNSLAGLYEAQEDYARAEPLFRQALEIRSKALGGNHPDDAATLASLALLYQQRGDYARAEPLYRQALEIQKKALGENHPDYARSLDALATLYEAQTDYVRAEPLFRQAASIVRKQVESLAAVQSERQHLALLQTVRWHLDRYLQLAAKTGQFSAPACREALAWQAAVVHRDRCARPAAQTPDLTPSFQQLQQVARQLAELAGASPDPNQETFWREKVARLAAERDRLELELSGRSAVRSQAEPPVTLEEVQTAMPAGAVLIDFLEYARYTPPNVQSKTKAAAERRLLAFVICPGRPVELLDLGPAGPLGEAIDAWQATFGMSPQAAAAGRLLRQRIWEPLEGRLSGAKIVLLSADGPLKQFPLAALPGANAGKCLADERTFALLPLPQMLPQMVHEEGRKQLQKNLLLPAASYPGPARCR
jgi:tetratricopeptide (TPR) repeat protein